MVAYSFQPRFAPLIIAGKKCQTIRRERTGKTRHARPGDELQLFTGLRTSHTRKIGTAVCRAVYPIELFFCGPREGYAEGHSPSHPDPRFATAAVYKKDVNEFARGDGFKSWDELVGFWRDTHPDPQHFAGVVIAWESFKP